MPRRLHIVGCPRSGTTLLMELMVTCFENSGFCDHEMSLFKEPEGSPELFFSKQPTDIKYLEKAFRQDENLFVIYMVRDPRAVITSIHQARPGEYFCNFRVWQECACAAQRLDGHPRFCKVRYEDLVRDPDAVQDHIEQRFGFLKSRHRFSAYEKNAKPSPGALKAMSGLRAVEKTRISGWQAHLSRIKAEYVKHPEMIDALIENGYEVDSRWTEILADVTPVEFPCRYPDKVFILKELDTKVRKWFETRRYLRQRNRR